MKRRITLTFLWLLTDALLYVAAYALAYFLKVGWIFSSDLPFGSFIGVVALTIPGWLFVMITLRNFALSRVQQSLRNAAYIAYACIIGMAGFTLAFYFLEQSLFSRQLLLAGGAFSFLFIFLWHILFDQIQRSILRMHPPAYPLLVIGTNREARRLIERLQKKRSPLTPVAILDNKSGPADIAGVPVLGKLNKLEETLDAQRISHLVQCDALEHSINLLGICRSRGITYLLLPYVLGIIERNVPSESLEGQQVLAVEPKNQWQWFFR